MTADRLRQAATLLRERAEAATPGTWVLTDPLPPTKYTTYEGGIRSTSMAEGFDDSIGKTLDHADAAYIATMSPPVALALADWLDAEAKCCEEADAHADENRDLIRAEFTSREEALTLASAILGDA